VRIFQKDLGLSDLALRIRTHGSFDNFLTGLCTVCRDSVRFYLNNIFRADNAWCYVKSISYKKFARLIRLFVTFVEISYLRFSFTRLQRSYY